MKIITDYKHSIGSHCSSVLMKNILNTKGIAISEEMCFGIGAGIGFIYRKAFNPPYYFVLGRSDDLEDKICYFLGAVALRYTTDDADRAWEESKKLIDNNEPVLVNLDASCIGYLRDKFDMFEDIRYGGHRAIIIGYDEEKGIALLADYLWNKPQEVSIEELKRARSSPVGQTPPDNLFYTFLFPEQFTRLEWAIRGGIFLNVRAMLNPWYEVLGLPGLKKFCERVTSWPCFMNKEMLKMNAYMTAMMLEEVGTGGGNFRRLYSRFLREAQEIVQDDNIGAAAKIYADLGNRWKEVAHLLKESSQDVNSGMWADRKTNQILLDEIAQKEESAILKLKEVSYV